ncbi:hypothetical protein BO70DRAFT_358565, partial [Aspergillus heteromorphus CBS 117.55]
MRSHAVFPPLLTHLEAERDAHQLLPGARIVPLLFGSFLFGSEECASAAAACCCFSAGTPNGASYKQTSISPHSTSHFPTGPPHLPLPSL